MVIKNLLLPPASHLPNPIKMRRSKHQVHIRFRELHLLPRCQDHGPIANADLSPPPSPQIDFWKALHGVPWHLQENPALPPHRWQGRSGPLYTAQLLCFWSSNLESPVFSFVLWLCNGSSLDLEGLQVLGCNEPSEGCLGLFNNQVIHFFFPKWHFWCKR